MLLQGWDVVNHQGRPLYVDHINKRTQWHPPVMPKPTPSRAGAHVGEREREGRRGRGGGEGRRVPDLLSEQQVAGSEVLPLRVGGWWLAQSTASSAGKTHMHPGAQRHIHRTQKSAPPTLHEPATALSCHRPGSCLPARHEVVQWAGMQLGSKLNCTTHKF